MTPRDLALRLRALLKPRRVERDLHDELASHLDLETRKLEGAGFSATDARREALKRFGSPALAADQCREQRRVTAVTDVLADIRFAIRQFLRRPLSSLTMIMVLALGIGSVSSVVILSSSLESSPPAAVGLDDAAVRIRGIDRGRGPGLARGREFPYSEYREYAAAAETFHSVGAWTSSDVVLDVGQGTEQLISGAATYVTGAYFPVIGVRMSLGAGLPSDTVDEGPPVLAAVISHAIWERHFDRTRDVIGRTMKVNGVTVTITGVAPRRFAGARSGGSIVRVWLPLNARPVAQRTTSRDSAVFGLVARLRPDVDPARATTVVEAIAGRHQQGVDRDAGTRLTTDVVPLLSENYFPPSGEEAGGVGRYFAFAMPLFVLLITCTNVSALLAGIALSRRREIAVRLSLGAHRGRIIRQLLTETAVLALCAGALGLGVMAIIIRVFDATVLGAPLMIDWRAGLFTAVIALATGLIFGLSPALHATRLAVSDVLKDSDVVGRRSRLQATLVVAQIALTQPALLSMGALLLELREDLDRSATSLLGQEVLEVRFNTNPRYGAIDARREATIDRVRRRVESVPGVRAVVPQDMNRDSARISSHDADRVPGVPGAPETDDVSVRIHSAPPGYFAALGRELERGREFGSAERSTDGLVVIDRALAQRLWGDVPAVGRRLVANDTGESRNAGVFTVIGVADDRGPRGLFLPDVSLTSHLLIRTGGPAGSFAQAIRAAALAEAPDLPIISARSLAVVEAEAQQPALLGIAAAGGIGLLALSLAAIGLYGVIAVTVAQRVREIGIRAALGGDRRRIVGLFVAGGLRLSVMGLTIGLALSVVSARGLAAAQGNTPPSGLLMLSVTIAMFVMAVALAASWVPARRAAAVDPLTALRAD